LASSGFSPSVIGAVVKAARARKLDPAAMLATGFAESGLNPGAVNKSSGATGLFQFLPSTWQGMGGTGSATNPVLNANLAARGMAQAGASGLTGRSALEKMITGFERPGPAGVQSDLSRALPFMKQAQQLVSQYGGMTAQPSAMPRSGAIPQTGGGGGGGLDLSALGPILRYLSKPIDPSKIGVGPQPGLPMGLINNLLKSLSRDSGPGAGLAGQPSGTVAQSFEKGHGRQPIEGPEKLIGLPYQGTHTMYGNWESDNAVDIATPVGTPIYAISDGTIGSQFGALDSSDPHLEGLRLHLDGPTDSFYYAHLSRFAPGIQPGVRVKAGQLLGYSGSANGVAHLHLASENRDPRTYLS
jgi:murein DD-endopeptidase MepM/ murein hydrolase activator NlpD